MVIPCITDLLLNLIPVDRREATIFQLQFCDTRWNLPRLTWVSLWVSQLCITDSWIPFPTALIVIFSCWAEHMSLHFGNDEIISQKWSFPPSLWRVSLWGSPFFCITASFFFISTTALRAVRRDATPRRSAGRLDFRRSRRVLPRQLLRGGARPGTSD